MFIYIQKLKVLNAEKSSRVYIHISWPHKKHPLFPTDSSRVYHTYISPLTITTYLCTYIHTFFRQMRYTYCIEPADLLNIPYNYTCSTWAQKACSCTTSTTTSICMSICIMMSVQIDAAWMGHYTPLSPGTDGCVYICVSIKATKLTTLCINVMYDYVRAWGATNEWCAGDESIGNHGMYTIMY